MKALVDALGTDSPVFMYTGFERRVLREAAERDPTIAPALDAIIARLVDLHEITAEHYYHPAQKASWSMKAVLPTIAPELDYANLVDVADGGGAQLAYLELIDTKTTAGCKAALESALRIYCRRDSKGMVRIVERSLVKSWGGSGRSVPSGMRCSHRSFARA